MDRPRSADARGAPRGSPAASELRGKVVEEDGGSTGVDVAGASDLGLARGVALVVQAHGEAELFGRGRETADPLGLVPFLAAQRQRQPDDERVDVLVARDPFELGEVFDHAPSNERPERPPEAVRAVAHGGADAAGPEVDARGRHAPWAARWRDAGLLYPNAVHPSLFVG